MRTTEIKNINQQHSKLEQLALLQKETGLSDKAFHDHVMRYFESLIPSLKPYFESKKRHKHD